LGGVSDLFLAEEVMTGEPDLFFSEDPLTTLSLTGDWEVELVDSSIGIGSFCNSAYQFSPDSVSGFRIFICIFWAGCASSKSNMI
jgi:hypothetical protein